MDTVCEYINKPIYECVCVHVQLNVNMCTCSNRYK